jgi:hypothetical protein
MFNEIKTEIVTVNLSYHPHYKFVKKSYFNKNTNHPKELEFLEKNNLFILELILASPESKVNYDIYSDQSNKVVSGTIKNNSASKIITIISDTEDDEYFVKIKIMTDSTNVVQEYHHFISKYRAEKEMLERQKKSIANMKYKEENSSDLEEIVEYTSFTRTSVNIVDLLNAATIC